MTIYKRWGLSQNPYVTHPIDNDDLDLFIGRTRPAQIAGNVLSEKGVLIIEGNRGVGTTSFGNYLRFTRAAEYSQFTPKQELSVGAGWNEELLLANMLSILSWELEERTTLGTDERFKTIKAATRQIRETYRNVSVQLSILGSGGGLGMQKETLVTMPQLTPTATLIKYLTDVRDLIAAAGFSGEIIIQLDNLDVDTLFSRTQLADFLNRIRDILQIEGYSWILVGDTGLRNFITDKVDRLDDIITYDCAIDPLSFEEVQLAVEARIHKYATNGNPHHPIAEDLLQIIYTATKGRIRQIYGLATRLIHSIEDNLMVEQITPEIAFPIIRREVEDRIRQNGITVKEQTVLNTIAQNPGLSPTRISRDLGLSLSNISRALAHLLKARLVSAVQRGRKKEYFPAPETLMALNNTLSSR